MITVLSLFDGLGGARIAMDRLGIPCKYYASEINKDSIKIAMKNYPDIIQLGDITKIKGCNLPKIDLLTGGSPCQDLSNAKPNGEGLNGEKSKLFYEFNRLLKEIKPTFFLLENVKMKQEWEEIVTTILGVKPIELNSNLVSAQNRKRLYWTNISYSSPPKDKGLFIKDIIYDDDFKVFTDIRIDRTRKFTKHYIKWDLSGKGYWSQQDRAYFKDDKMCTVPKANPSNKLNIWLGDNKYRRCHPIEAERLQTLPDNYTDCIKSIGKRIGIIGDGWTVDIIVHILKGIKE